MIRVEDQSILSYSMDPILGGLLKAIHGVAEDRGVAEDSIMATHPGSL